MSSLGQWQTLFVDEVAGEGLYLHSPDLGEVFLPAEQAPDDVERGDSLSVFVYLDNMGHPTATRTKPSAQVGDFALLQVKQVNKIGAFLDWGLEKDLLVPFNEQKPRMQPERSYLVKLYLDNASKRICASSNLNKFVGRTQPDYKNGDLVDIIVAGKTDLGFKVIVDELHWGLIFHNRVHRSLFVGQRLKAYVQQCREDGKLDIVLEAPGMAKIDPLKQQILDELNARGGLLPLGDKSAPEAIKRQFGTSKANFKKAIGGLFKDGVIDIEATQIKLKTRP
ncbi:S1-like domain-containing RNA-binding protein [Pseudoalteromonas sp. BDTF-M6]|uniref:CvfB family protein n=1 Tax=Pseudoalteromonas sp. BDTF-M6 TaxID=2796132 RepID=UPI001BAFEE09|nr:S1-like domain-containing RNA-binding protein [Pseudoalteromonas sp. BDTF-M6]MBS3796592.1 GntR family transcriptional regulator [Pseudoalteromonas sp. BDTF-M6]